MFYSIPSVGGSNTSCRCLSSLLPAAVGVQALCEEDRDGCGSRDRNFKPNTKGWETRGSWHLYRPSASLLCFNMLQKPSRGAAQLSQPLGSSMRGVQPGLGRSCCPSPALPGSSAASSGAARYRVDIGSLRAAGALA